MVSLSVNFMIKKERYINIEKKNTKFVTARSSNIQLVCDKVGVCNDSWILSTSYFQVRNLILPTVKSGT